jgi:hypothetical protein
MSLVHRIAFACDAPSCAAVIVGQPQELQAARADVARLQTEAERRGWTFVEVLEPNDQQRKLLAYCPQHPVDLGAAAE